MKGDKSLNNNAVMDTIQFSKGGLYNKSMKFY